MKRINVALIATVIGSPSMGIISRVKVPSAEVVEI